MVNIKIEHFGEILIACNANVLQNLSGYKIDEKLFKICSGFSFT
jgi:hypothetical protein